MANEELTCVGIGLMSAICSTAALFFLMKLRSMKVGLESKSKPQTKDSNGSKKGWLGWFKEKFQSFKDSAKTAASYVAAPFQKSEVEPEDGNWILMDVSQISSDQEDFKSRVLTEGQKLDLKTVSKNEIIYIPKDQENCLSQSSSLLNQCHHADCLRKEKLENALATNKTSTKRRKKGKKKSSGRKPRTLNSRSPSPSSEDSSESETRNKREMKAKSTAKSEDSSSSESESESSVKSKKMNKTRKAKKSKAEAQKSAKPKTQRSPKTEESSASDSDPSIKGRKRTKKTKAAGPTKKAKKSKVSKSKSLRSVAKPKSLSSLRQTMSEQDSSSSDSEGWIEKFNKAKDKVKQKYKEEKREAKEFLRKKLESSSSDEIEAKVIVEKNPDDSDNFDVNVDIQVNEKHPVQIHVDAQIEDNAMDVHGSANTAEGTGEVKIEATLDDGNGSKANDEIELSVDSKNSDSDSMHLETK